MSIKMAMRRTKYLLTLTLRVSQGELLLTRFKRALRHGEGLKLWSD